MIYAIAIGIINLLPFIALVLKILFSVLLLALMFYYLRKYAWLLAQSSCVAMRIDGGKIVLICLDGREVQGDLARDSFVMSAMTIVNMVSSVTKERHSVVIFPDSMDQERYRKLRVLLKWADIETV